MKFFSFIFIDLEQSLAKVGAIRLPDAAGGLDDDTNDEDIREKKLVNVTRIRSGGAGHRKHDSDSDDDSD